MAVCRRAIGLLALAAAAFGCAQAQQPAQDPPLVRQWQEQMTARHAGKAKGGAVAPPPRNEARLASLPRTLLTRAQLPAYVASVHKKVLQGLAPEQRRAAAALAVRVRNESRHGDPAVALRQAGTLAWVLRQPVAAAVLLGHAATDAPTDAQTLSNYAAALTTLGVADLGIPILQRLDADSPNNSTVLNNLGQAWFSLGATAAAKKALKSAVLVFARHAQANETLSHILESEGDNAGAGEALERSVEEGYSAEKAARLTRLGRSVPRARIGAHLPMAQDPLGLSRFVPPDFCKSAAEARACQARINQHTATVEAAIARIDQELAALASRPASERDPPLAPGERVVPLPLAAVARARQRFLDDDFAKRPVWPNEVVFALQDKMVKQQEPILDAFGKQSIHDPCGAGNGATASANAAAAEFFATVRPPTQRYIGESAYLSQFTGAAAQLDTTLLLLKRHFLTFFAGVHGTPLSMGCPNGPPEVPKGKLADFYDLNCPNIVTFSVPAIGDWTVRCNKMITHLNVSVPEIGALAGITLGGSLTQNLETGVVESGSVEIGVSVGVGAGSAGPLAGEMAATGGIGVTYGSRGIDVVVRGGVQVSGTNLGDLPVADATAGVAVSINSGVTVTAPTGSALNIPLGGPP